MAQIIGGITTSHIPAIGVAIAENKFEDPYWKPFFDGYPAVHHWLDETQPDIAVVFYNDHGLEFFLDKKPTFAISTAAKYQNDDEGWGIKPIPDINGETELSWHIVNALIEDEFDITVCQEMRVDHGLTVPMSLLWPNNSYGNVKVIPVCINIERHPMPKPSRCYKLGQAIGKAIESFSGNQKVVVIGTGGLSHQLDGERAGFINKEFDLYCMDNIVSKPEALSQLSIYDLVDRAGAQGPELINWLAMRGSLRGDVTELHRNFHIPISNTAAGLLLLENR